jgi:hypothetical protein
MYDYKKQIKDFINEHFSPATATAANIKMNTDQLLSFIFTTFPNGCISDYDLNEILISLGYTRTTYTVAIPIAQTNEEKDKNSPVQFAQQLCTGWCLISYAMPPETKNLTD